ncbi:MAG: nitroreductase family protein [Clostridiales bacterium]|nr:nitroreductase family protein [Clostridiales bacterium]
MENPVLSAIASRRSHRRYKPDQLTEDQLNALIDAMLQSPSAQNKQPWHFSIVQKPELSQQLTEAARKRNNTLPEAERSPRFEDPAFNVFYHAPTVVVISAPDSTFSPVDCGIAVQNIALAAQSMGLGSVIVGLVRFAFEGEERAELEQALQMPAGYKFRISIAVGTPDDEKAAPSRDRAKVSLIR